MTRQAADVASSCPACGAPITHAEDEDGTHIVLDKWTEPDGDRRYRIVELGPPLVVALVSEQSGIDAYPDHRKECPDYEAGRGAHVR